MKPTYRYFRRINGQLCKVLADGSWEGNMRLDATTGGEWKPCSLNLWDMTGGKWISEPPPVEYFPDTEQPTYRYFRQGCGEWKVQTTDPESHEGNFYRNAETPWLSASQSLSDLLEMGATEVGASVEQVPRWAVAVVFEVTTTEGWKTTKAVRALLNIAQADTEEQAIGLVLADLHKRNPGTVAHQPLVMRVP